MARRIVAAIGGNALGETLPEQRRAAGETARVLGGLIQGGTRLCWSMAAVPRSGSSAQP